MAYRIQGKLLTCIGYWNNHVWKFLRVSKNYGKIILSEGWAVDVVLILWTKCECCFYLDADYQA